MLARVLARVVLARVQARESHDQLSREVEGLRQRVRSFESGREYHEVEEERSLAAEEGASLRARAEQMAASRETLAKRNAELEARLAAIESEHVREVCDGTLGQCHPTCHLDASRE